MNSKTPTCYAIGKTETPAIPSRTEIAARLLRLADEMDDLVVAMDYYGGFATWAKHGREISGAGTIARQWAAEIYGDKTGLENEHQHIPEQTAGRMGIAAYRSARGLSLNKMI